MSTPPVICDRCGLVFSPANSDDQAMAEFREKFADDPVALADLDEEGPAIVCDDCYRAFWEWLPKDPAQRLK